MIVVLFAIVVALYGGTLGHPFLVDDPLVIGNDPRVTEGRFLDLLTGSYWPEATTDRLYRPLVSLSYALTYAIFPEPWAFRLPNLLLHAVACVLVFLLTRGVFKNEWAAGAAALLFAAHPAHTEPLNAIAGRADLGAFVFATAAALLWWRDGDPSRPPRRFRPLAAALLFAAGTLCKESALTLVGIVAVLDLWRRSVCGLQRAEKGDAESAEGYRGRREEGVERAREEAIGRRNRLTDRMIRCYGPMVVVVLGYLLLRHVVLGQLTSSEAIPRALNPVNTPAELLAAGDSAALVRWGTPLATFSRACRLMVLPWPLSHDYSYDAIAEVRRWSDPRLWFGLAWLAVVVAACVASLRRTGAVCVAIAIAVGQYFLVSNVPVVIGTIFGERLLYAPSAGFCMAVGLLAANPLREGVAALRDRAGRRASLSSGAVVAALVVLVGSAALVWLRNADWSHERRLLASIPPDDPVSYKILNSYAEQEFREAGTDPAGKTDPKVAANHFRSGMAFAERARAKAPENWVAYERIGVAQYELGDADAAIKSLNEAVRRGAKEDLRTLEYLGLSHLARQEFAGAIAAQEALVRLLPRHARAHAKLAEVLLLAEPPLRDLPRAEREARLGVSLGPRDGWTHVMLARVIAQFGRLQEAVEVVREALRVLPPTDPYVGELKGILIQLQAAGS